MIRQTINIDDIVYAHFVKYDTLDFLIHYAFAGSKSNMLNIYIDLYGLYHQIISRNYITNVKDQIECPLCIFHGKEDYLIENVTIEKDMMELIKKMEEKENGKVNDGKTSKLL